MAKKLSEDYIRFTLSLSTSEAQQEIRKLEKASRELKEENKSLKKSMADLTATGKRDTEEFRNLEAQLKKNNRTITENNTKITRLTSTIDRSGKSYSQLRKEATALQKQLENTVKSLQPEEYKRLQKELDETREAMNRLKKPTNELTGILKGWGKLKIMFGGFFTQFGIGAANFLTDSLGKMKEFAAQGIEMATDADGVLRAFRQLDNPNLLNNLRQATKHTVNDLQLMQAAVKARDFRIPLEDMGKYLAFAQLKAQQTGQSVDYMTDSIVTGLGRKSLLILDNLGLSAAEINEEVARTGDFMEGVAAIVDRQLAQAGQYVSARDEATQADVRLQNAQLRLGQKLAWVGGLWNGTKNAMAAVIEAYLEVDSAEARYYKKKERHLELEEEHRVRIHALLDSCRDIALADMERVRSLAELRKEYPKIFSQYDLESIKLADVLKLKRQIAEEDGRRREEQWQKDFDAARKRYYGYGTSLTAKEVSGGKVTAQERRTLERLKEELDVFYKDRGKKVSEEFIASLQQIDLKDFDRYVEQLEKRMAGKGYAGKIRMKLPIDVEGTLSEEVLFSVREIKDLIQTVQAVKKDRSTPKQETRNKTYWEQRLKEAEDARNALDEQEKNSARWNELTRQIEEAKAKIEEIWGGGTKTATPATASSGGGMAGVPPAITPLTPEESAAAEEERWQAEMEAVRKGWQQYFIEYGDYRQQRKALAEKYDEELARLEQDSPEYAMGQARKAEALKRLDAQYAGTTRLMADLFEDASRKSVNALQDIIDRYELLIQYLSGTRNADGSGVTQADLAAAGFTPGQLQAVEDGKVSAKELADGLEKLKGSLADRSPWLTFTKGLDDGIRLMKRARGDADRMGAGLELIGASVRGFTGPLGEFASSLATIFGADDAKVQSLISSVDGLGQTAAGVGRILSGDLAGGAMSAAGGIASVVSALEGAFGADYSRYNALKQQYEGLIDVWDTLISKKQKYIDINYGDEARKSAEEAKKLVQENEGRYRELMKSLASSGSSMGSHSLGVRIYDRLNSDDWRRISELVGQNITHEYQFWDLSAGQIEKLLTDPKLIQVLNTVDSRFVQYMQSIVDGKNQLEELEKQARATLTGVTFDDFYDNYTSMLLDLDKDNEDFADNFGEYLRKALLKNLVANKYKAELQKLYDAWVAASDTDGDGAFDLTDEEAARLQQQEKELTDRITAERDALLKAFGLDGNGSSAQNGSAARQEASRGFGTEMTHEDAGELSGRFTAVYETGVRQEAHLLNITIAVSQLAVQVTAQLECSTEIRDILTECNGHLEKIEKYTSLLPRMAQLTEACESHLHRKL